MARYYRVEINQFRSKEWVAFIEETCYTLTAASRSGLEAAVKTHLEEALGEKHYQIVWLG